MRVGSVEVWPRWLILTRDTKKDLPLGLRSHQGCFLFSFLFYLTLIFFTLDLSHEYIIDWITDFFKNVLIFRSFEMTIKYRYAHI